MTWQAIDPRGEPNSIILLSEHSIKMTPNALLLYQHFRASLNPQPLSEKHLLAVVGREHRDP